MRRPTRTQCLTRAVLSPTLALLALALPGCMEMLRSDSANALHQASQARREALVGNRLASQQAAPALPLAGAALVQLLSNKTHVSEYRKASSDRQPYYAEYEHYGADGHYQALNTYERKDPATAPVGRWQVEGPLLCITEQRAHSSQQCFTVRLEAGGALQYWNHEPGDDFHGLLARRVDTVRTGPVLPAFSSTPYQMR